MITIDFTVPGKPVGKERPRVTAHGTYTPPKTREYEDQVARAFLEQLPDGHNPSGVAFAEIYITAYFAVPKSWTIAKRRDSFDRPAPKKPDADNIGKAVCDALNGIAYKDDACVTELDIAKRFCGEGEPPRVEVTVALAMD